MSKPTPGPWAMYGATLMTENKDKYERLNIAEFAVMPHPANLSLIVSAPELLLTLTAIVGEIREMCIFDDSDQWETILGNAEVLIAKAEGRT